jgi:ABC-type transporter Mla subunit MlaD
MSNTKHPVTSGFDDADIVLSNVNKKEELQDENEKLDARMEQVNGALYRAEEALKKANAIVTRIETATESLSKSADKIEPALNAMADNMSKDKRFKFTAQLDDKSIKSIKAQHEEYVKEEKKLLSEHREALKTSMSESVAEEKKAFENHKIEMERTKEYGEGVWFSKRAWGWIFGFMIVSGFWFVASVTAAIVIWVK